ncbi:glycosyl hydrolase family 18 protein [Paenibacillus sp. J5C_2022]|uniref:glycosyl hydrolase family 18 protein n=1 Tax=Paenibacillus sp. J5C2022 TaxID=2977129 RepID=UPI0021CEC3E7|nr:glycosyl hydrolase family 18 protein [Paenibacillus sp. J5C2022]MCU6711187.1 glycosyl hydrolase family 18 protein [Paenibacillus sp. J5C2022]
MTIRGDKVNPFTRKTNLRVFVLFLCCALLLSPFLHLSPVYGEEAAPDEPTEEVKSEGTQNPQVVEGTVTATEATIASDQAAKNPPAQGASNLQVGEVTHNTAELTWTPAPGIDDYWVWDSNNTYIIWANSGYKLVGGLKPETTYSFYLGPDGVQAPQLKPEQKSNVVTFTTLPDTSEYEAPPLAPPHNLKVTSISDESVTFGWTGSPGADGYDFYANGNWMGGVWDGSNAYTFAVPEQTVAGSTYRFEVGAQNSQNSDVSANSNAITITWGMLPAPVDLQVVTSNRTTAAIGWAAVPGATGYDVYMNEAMIGTTDDNRYTIEGLAEGQSYSFQVRASNALWQSAMSEMTTVVPGSQYTNVTYYTQWSIYDRDYHPEDVAVSHFTHINYAFADLCWRKYATNGTECRNGDIPLQNRYVHDGEMIIGDPEADIDNFNAFAAIKESNPHLKLLISVGGWSWSNNFSNMAADERTRRAFANSVVDYLREYQLDGLDIDWEYPVEGGEEDNSHRPEDKANFTLMMKTVREALDAASAEDGKYYLLTIASGQGDNFVQNADLANSVHHMDFINIMTYDYGGSWETIANHNAPLYYDLNNPKPSAPRNHASGGALGHLNGGVPSYKLVFGIPYYGVGWAGCPPDGEYRTCESIPPGSWESGKFDFTDIENNYMTRDDYAFHWNDAAKSAFLYNEENGIFLSFNNETSMMYIASFVKSMNLAGVMNWEISADRNLTLTKQLSDDLPINGIVNGNALQAPMNVALTSSTVSELHIQWDEVDDAAKYEVYIDGRYALSTEATSAVISNLDDGTAYRMHVLAIRMEGASVSEVSPASEAITATTQSIPAPPAAIPLPPAVNDNELNASISRSGGTWIANILGRSSIREIESVDSDIFTVTADNNAEDIVIRIPQEVIEAMVAKDNDSWLFVIWNDVIYKLPADALSVNADVRITLSPPDEEIMSAIEALAEARGLQLAASPLDFKVERKTAKDRYEEISDFGGHLLIRAYQLDGDGINRDRMTGVLYLPDSDELRPVHTRFTTDEDGSLIAELLSGGNSIYAVVSSSFRYADADSEVMAWARDSVSQVAARLLLAGESDNYFGVMSRITRAEFTSMLVKGLGLAPDYSASPFSDVQAGTMYAGDIAAAKSAGLINGKTDTRFDPDGTITRQEMAGILAKALMNAGMEEETAQSVLDRFSDMDAIASYAKPAVSLLFEKGIMIGVSESRYNPEAEVTRAQAAVALMRTLSVLERA